MCSLSDMVKPYYEQDGITIYHGDCLDILPSIVRADACITDPPYNVGRDYCGNDSDKQDDGIYEEWCRAWFKECQTCAPAIAFTPGISNVAFWCSIQPPTWILAWNKPAAMSRSTFGFNQWDPVLFWGKAPHHFGATDVITAPIVDRNSKHPTPKPVLLMTGLVSRLSEDGDIVLDPFAGSGTTLVAAKQMGRRAIGIEMEEAYCEFAAERLAQGSLFAAV